MKAKDIMTASDLTVVADSISIRQVAQLLADNDIGSIPVLDDSGRLEGIVTDRDICCRAVAAGLAFDAPIRQVMSQPVYTIDPDADVRELEQVMRAHKIRRVPVVDSQGRLEGFVAQADLLLHLQGKKKEEHELVEVLESISEP